MTGYNSEIIMRKAERGNKYEVQFSSARATNGKFSRKINNFFVVVVRIVCKQYTHQGEKVNNKKILFIFY